MFKGEKKAVEHKTTTTTNDAAKKKAKKMVKDLSLFSLGKRSSLRSAAAAEFSATSSVDSPIVDQKNNIPDLDVADCSHTLIIIFPSLEEFAQEREILRSTILPEFQQYCCDLGVDLICCTTFETEEILQNIQAFIFISDLLQKPDVSILCFIGDKYGNEMLPMEFTVDEYNAIRTAALESGIPADDIKLFENFYAQDRNGERDRYRLRTAGANRDNQGARRLLLSLKNAIQKAFEDGHLYQMNEDARINCFKSFIHMIVEATLESNAPVKKHVIVSRRLSGYLNRDENWVDEGDKYRRIEALKNSVSLRLTSKEIDKAFHLPFLIDLHEQDPSNWIRSKEATTYEKRLFTSIMESLKAVIATSHPSQTANQPSLAPILPIHIAQIENKTHTNFLAQIQQQWVGRPEVDSLLKKLVEKLDTQSTFVQLHGAAGCGKSATLCRLFQLLNKEKFYAVIRFSHLSDHSIFANELFRNIFYTVCELANRDPEKIFGSAFHIASIFAQANTFLEELDKKVVVLIDDAHLIRQSRTLSKMEDMQNLSGRLSIICTSPNATPLLSMKPEIIELCSPSTSTSTEILMSRSDDYRKRVKSFHMSDSNLLIGEIQFRELLEGYKEKDISKSIEARFQRIENTCGIENVRIVCELICCAPYGITLLELTDGYRLRKFTTAMTFEPDDVFSILPFLVVRYLGDFLCSTVIDSREVINFRHASVAQIVKQRYLQSTGEIKLVNEIMGEVLGGSQSSDTDDNSEAAASVMLFPQPLKRENGAINARSVRQQWHYLLYSGNIESLKSLALCSFTYLEAVFRACGLARLLSIFEECLLQILDHDLLVIFEQVLLPAISTLTREPRQFVSEFLNRLRYTRSKNSPHLNSLVEQAMQWTDNYNSSSLLVPLTCWISPPKMKEVLSFTLPHWTDGESTVSRRTLVEPTRNHQHLLVSGSASAPGSIHMFHLASQLLIKTFSAHDQPVSALCASNDGQFFVSTALDGTIKLWNLNQTECIKTLQPTKAKILCALLGSNDSWVVIGGSDSSARVISLVDGHVTHNFREHTGPVVGLQLSSDNSLLVTGSGDFVVTVFDIETSSLQQSVVLVRLCGLMAPVTCLALTSNDAFLAVACEDETLRIFSLVSATELHELSGHDSKINAMTTSADDCQLFAATRGKIFVFDIHNAQLLEVLHCAQQVPVTCIKTSDDNTFIIVACGNQIHVWDNSIERDDVHTGESALSCIEITPDEKGAGCGLSPDGILAFWDLDVCQLLWTTSHQKTGAVTALCFTADSFYLLSGSESGSIALWETSNGRLIRQMTTIHSEPVAAICCFADGVRVGSWDKNGQGQIWIWSAENKRVETIVNIPQMVSPVFFFSRLQDSLIMGRNLLHPKEMNIWMLNADTRPTGRIKVHHNEPIVCYCVNKIGSVLLTGSKDLSLKVWQLDSGGLLIQVLVGHEDIPTCCCVSVDGRLAASGGRDKNIIVWDILTGAVRKLFQGLKIPKTVALSHDGTVLISSAEDSWIEAMHTVTGRLLSSFNAHRLVEHLIMGADGDRILLLLSKTAQLPIICLHNSPANLLPHNRWSGDSTAVLHSPLIDDFSLRPPASGSTQPRDSFGSKL